MALVLVTKPASEVVDLHDVKLHVRVDSQHDDELLNRLIVSSRQSLEGPEGWLGRALMTQHWDLFLDRFPLPGDRHYAEAFGRPGLWLPLPPLQSVTSVSYTDAAGAPQTVASSDYVVDAKNEPGRIVMKAGKSWPSTAEELNAVAVRFVAGYVTAAAVPEKILTWIKESVAYRFERREAGVGVPAEFFWQVADYKVAW